MKEYNISRPSDMAGTVALALRLVIGWTYFSAFWRRLILENKLDPEAPGYIGEKFNHFLPNALGIKPLIEYMVTHPDALWWSMAAFTIIEAIVGLFLLLGLYSRLSSIGVILLAAGILLGSGWLGTTCLDEWQIGVLGVAGGFTLFFTGGGNYSLDNYLRSKGWFCSPKSAFLTSGSLPVRENILKKAVLAGSAFILMLTLYTNQYFHGGVFGTLHNKSVRPHIAINHAGVSGGNLVFSLYRTEGADVYGSFLIGAALMDSAGTPVLSLDGEDLSRLPVSSIENKYVAKVKPGKHSLIVPLGASAEVTVSDAALKDLPAGNYVLLLTDISGITWQAGVNIK